MNDHQCASPKCRLLALNGHNSGGPARQLSKENRPRQPFTGAADFDPQRHFANVKWRSAKGLFDHLVLILS
jgi:hypothetical protein